MLQFANHGIVGAYLSFKILEFPFKLLNLTFIAYITPIFNNLNYKLVKLLISTSILYMVFATFAILCMPILNKIIIFILGQDFLEYLWMTKYILVIGVIQNYFVMLLNLLSLRNSVSEYNNVIKITALLKVFFSVIGFFNFGVLGLFYALILAPSLGIFIIYFKNLKALNNNF